MATAILDLDIQSLPLEITGLEGYDQALALIRLRGRPIGQAVLPLVGGRIGTTELRDRLVHAAGTLLWERWLHDYLDWDPVHHPDYSPPTASVAVCTRERPEDLRRCLEALMRLPDDGQDYLVVDNCPATDATRLVVEGYRRVRYIREERKGLNIARNRALMEAKGEKEKWWPSRTTTLPLMWAGFADCCVTSTIHWFSVLPG